MACQTLTSGRKLPCKGGVSGIKAVSFVTYEKGLLTLTDGELASIPSGVTAVYRYETKATSSNYTEEIAIDDEARTIVYNGTLALTLHKLDLETRNELHMLAMNEVIAFVEMNNGDILLVGSNFGANLTGSATTGGAKADFNGYNLTFATMEEEPYGYLSTGAKSTYNSIVVEGI